MRSGRIIVMPPEQKPPMYFIHLQCNGRTRRSLRHSLRFALKSPFARVDLPQLHRLWLSLKSSVRVTTLSHRFTLIILLESCFVNTLLKFIYIIGLNQLYVGLRRIKILSRAGKSFLRKLDSALSPKGQKNLVCKGAGGIQPLTRVKLCSCLC